MTTISAIPKGIDCQDWQLDPTDTVRQKRCIHYGKNTTSSTPNSMVGTCGLQRNSSFVRLWCSEYLKIAKVSAVNPSESGVSGAARATIPLAQSPLPSANSEAVPNRTQESSVGPPNASTPSAADLLATPPAKTTNEPVAPKPVTDAAGNLVLSHPTAKTPRKSAAEVARDMSRQLLGVTDLGNVDAVLLDAPAFEPAKAISAESIAALAMYSPEIELHSPELGSITLVAAHTNKDRLEMTFESAAVLRLIVDAFPGARVMKITRRQTP